MNFRASIDTIKHAANRPIPLPRSGRCLQNLLYWLAGARQSTLAQLPESERERVAILGSSVLIPTLLAFLGMYLYAAHRFQSSRPFVSLLLALVWAFIIMNVDRILLATYRPFQPLRRKIVQICFRVGLAAVISVAIAFPFCLEQYQGAIKERLQGEHLKQLQDLQVKERADREQIETRTAAITGELKEQLKRERASGPVDPGLYAETLARQTISQRDDRSLGLKQQLQQEAMTAQAEWKGISARVREVEQDIKEEGQGRLAQDRGGTGKPGQGAKVKELERELSLLRTTEQTARLRYEQLLSRAAAIQPVEPLQDALASLEAGQQTSLLAEATNRKGRIDQLEASVRRTEAEHIEQMDSHRQQFEPLIQRTRSKVEGSFDPMEETIGLVKVIFVPEGESNASNQLFQRYKWMAALFQFSIVFGTLFLLDLIAILAKVMSRPGPYDVLVEFPELICTENLNAIKKEYTRSAGAWASAATLRSAQAPKQSNQNTINLRNAEEMADFLFRAHLHSPGGRTDPPGVDDRPAAG